MALRSGIVFLFACIGLLMCGCPRSVDRGPVVKSVLPEDIAGTWKARESAWKIVLDRNGTVSSAVVSMGEVEVRPNKTTEFDMKDGSISRIKGGDCVVDYTAATRNLYVSIEVEEVHIVFGEAVIDGNSVDRFIGHVSEDGKEWVVDWINVFDYGPRFPQDPNDVYAQPLIFEKIEE